MDTFIWQPNEHEKRKELLFELGWKWTPDTYHPKNAGVNPYDLMVGPRTYGWYTNEAHHTKNVLVGDSKPRFEAAQIVKQAYL